jgi:hypothetical protein
MKQIEELNKFIRNKQEESNGKEKDFMRITSEKEILQERVKSLNLREEEREREIRSIRKEREDDLLLLHNKIANNYLEKINQLQSQIQELSLKNHSREAENTILRENDKNIHNQNAMLQEELKNLISIVSETKKQLLLENSRQSVNLKVPLLTRIGNAERNIRIKQRLQQ